MTFMSASLNVTKVGNSGQTINMIKEYYAYCNKEAENVSYEFPLAVLISGGFEAYLLMLHWFFPWSQRLGLAIPEYSVVCWLTNLKHRIGQLVKSRYEVVNLILKNDQNSYLLLLWLFQPRYLDLPSSLLKWMSIGRFSKLDIFLQFARKNCNRYWFMLNSVWFSIPWLKEYTR